MSWNHEKDPHRKPSNNPETKAETYPKKQPSDKTIKELGRKAIKGSK